MKKVSKAIKAFIAILKKPYLLNAVLNSEELLESEFQVLFPSANEKKQISFSTLFPLVKDVNVYPYSFLSGSSLATDFALLQLLCKKIEAEDYFEIGTWRGESVANVAPYVKNCFTLNLSDDVMLKKGLDKSYIQMHRFYSEGIKNVTHLFGDSKYYDYSGLNKKFDLIFIDGDHHSESVKSDTTMLFPFLKNEKSVIVWHDAKLDTETCRYEVLMGIYQGMPQETHKHIYLVENTLCAIYWPYDLAFSKLVKNTSPENAFDIQLRIKK